MVYENAAGRIYGLKSGSCRFWQRDDLPPGSNKFRMVYENAAGRISWRSNMLRAEIQRTLRRAPRQLRGLRLGLQTRAGHGPDGAHANRSACPGGWKVLSGEFRRRPTALVIKFRKSDRVGRRGLSEPREDFSRLPTDAFPRLISLSRLRGSTQ